MRARTGQELELIKEKNEGIRKATSQLPAYRLQKCPPNNLMWFPHNILYAL